MGTARVLATEAARRSGRQDAVGRPDVRLPDDIASLLELATSAVGCLEGACGDHAALLRATTAIGQSAGQVDDRARRLCRMALREAYNRLSGDPRGLLATAAVADAYKRLGGEGL